jgi:hypothetical protein
MKDRQVIAPNDSRSDSSDDSSFACLLSEVIGHGRADDTAAYDHGAHLRRQRLTLGRQGAAWERLQTDLVGKELVQPIESSKYPQLPRRRARPGEAKHLQSKWRKAALGRPGRGKLGALVRSWRES